MSGSALTSSCSAPVCRKSIIVDPNARVRNAFEGPCDGAVASGEEKGETTLEINHYERCLNREILACVSYPPNSIGYWFPTPRYVLTADEVIPISEEAFPERGGLFVYGGKSPVTNPAETFGEVVTLTLRDVHVNTGYQPGGTENYNQYAADYTGGPFGEIDMTAIRRSGASTQLSQIVELATPIELSQPDEGLRSLAPNSARGIYTARVWVRTSNGTRNVLVGPLEASQPVEGSLQVGLAAVPEADYMVYELPEKGRLAAHALTNAFGHKAMDFVLTSLLDEAIAGHDYEASYDWMPEDDLIAYLNDAMRQSEKYDELRRGTWLDEKGGVEAAPLSKNKLRKLNNLIMSCLEGADRLNLNQSRRDRIMRIASRLDEFTRLPDDVLVRMASELTDERIIELMAQPAFLELVLPRIPEIARIRELIDEDQKRYEDQMSEHQRDLDFVSGELSEKEESLERTEAELTRARQDLEVVRENALAEVREERERLDHEIADREGRIADLEVEEAGLKGAIRETVSEIRDEMRLSAEIVKSSLVRQAATLALAEESQEAPKSVAPFAIVGAEETPDSIIDGLCFHMEATGRDYERNEVVNFYLCLAQGYITTYAGLPGTGKTSLCRLLGGAIGLSPENGRLVEVSVERGWTSFRDYIGYYNPLTKSEVKSNADVFDALEALTAEADGDPSGLPLCAFILDEANLSPIEHYWAQFLNACDSFATSPMKLSIGGDRTFTVPPFTRFLATVNFDHTTEELSPRFLDRSWVVMLEPRDIDVSTPEGRPEAGWRGERGACLSYAKLVDTFGVDSSAVMSDDDRRSMNAVLQACQEAGRPVSPRSQRMMMSYITRARALMDTSTKDSRRSPVDFAVAQKVLPMIGGPRETTRPVVEGLLKACDGLTISSRLVERMRRSGEDSGFYQFFS